MKLLKWATNVLMVLVFAAAMTALITTANWKDFDNVIDAIVMDIP